jgi:hypothetical protein
MEKSKNTNFNKMKKAILLLPLFILAASVAGILFIEKDNSTVFEPTQKDEIKKLERQTITFEAPIENYFALDAAGAVSHEKLRIYPILGSPDYLSNHASLGELINLSEALATQKIRILEMGETDSQRQPDVVFNPHSMNGGSILPLNVEPNSAAGRAYAEGATVNTLTIENLSNDTVYIMAGDVVQGGRQDRVIAEDIIAMPNSGKVAIPVFCVEPSRWNYRNKPAGTQKKDEDQVFAFTGYFNVASNSIRHTVKHQKNQSEVWAKVGDMRTRHNVAGSTSTYGDLASSKSYNKRSQAYLDGLEGVFENSENVVGCLVVSGDQVLGCDIFGTSSLFKKQYKALIHAYVSEAITYGKKIQLSEEEVEDYFKASYEKYFSNQDKEKELELKFVHDGKIVHFTDI